MSVSWFRRFEDAIAEASWRAALTRLRYRVYFDPANGWWNISETTRALSERGQRP